MCSLTGRRRYGPQVRFALVSLTMLCSCVPRVAGSQRRARLVIDTDIGDDIDDTWALALLWAQPEIDVRLIVTDSYRPDQRVQVLARFLNMSRVSPHIALGPGIPSLNDQNIVLEAWASPADLAHYTGAISYDGVGALINEVADGAAMGETTKLLVLSPCRVVADAVRRAPWIVNYLEVYAMGGSLRAGDNGTTPPYAEWNIRADVNSARALYDSPRLSHLWPRGPPRLAPLDTAATAQLAGAAFQIVKGCSSLVARALWNMYVAWLPLCPYAAALQGPRGRANSFNTSSVVYDLLAASFVLNESFVHIEKLPISIDDTGRTVIDPQLGQNVFAATSWLFQDDWQSSIATMMCRDQQRAAMEIAVNV